MFAHDRQWFLAQFASLSSQIQQNQKETLALIMSTSNTTATNLQAAEAAIEADIAKLGTAISSEITDTKAALQAELSAAGVDPTVVATVTSRLTALDQTVQGLTGQVTAADPGTLAAPPVTPPATS